MGTKIFVITGAASCGKTTTINHLRRRGFSVIGEVARDVLTEGVYHPRKDPVAFQKVVAIRQLAEEKKIRKIAADGMAFLDRGLYDQFAYCRHFGIKKPLAVLKTKVNYDGVFVLEELPFEKDGVRIEKDLAEAAKIKDRIVEEYKKRGVACVFVPVMPPEERVSFILDRTNNFSTGIA